MHANQGLIVIFGRENTVGDGHTRAQLYIHHGAAAVIADDFEVIGLATNDGAERDQRVKRMFFVIRQSLQYERDFQGPRDATYGNVFCGDTQRMQFVDGARKQAITDILIESGNRDTDS